MHTSRKAHWGVKKEGAPPHNMWCQGSPIGLWDWIHLGKKLRMHVGEGPWAGQVWKKKPDNWSKVNKDPEELPYINDLTTHFLCSSSLGRTPTPLLSGCASLPCFGLNKLFLCVLSHLLLCCVSNNKLCTCFYSFCLLEKCIFQWGQEPGKICF